MSIQLGSYGNFSRTKINQICNATTKPAATKLSLWERFKDVFKGVANKQKTRLGKLFDHLQSPTIDSQYSIIYRSNNDLNASSHQVPNSCIDKLNIFAKIRKLALPNEQHRFKVLRTDNIGGMNLTLQFRLDDYSLTNANADSFEQAVIDKYVNSEGVVSNDLTKSGLKAAVAEEKLKVATALGNDATAAQRGKEKSLAAYRQKKEVQAAQFTAENLNAATSSIATINAKLPAKQRVSQSELANILAKFMSLKDNEIGDRNHARLITKDLPNTGVNQHSYLIYKQKDEYVILIKPNIKNGTMVENVFKGANKRIKAGGIVLRFTTDKKFKGSYKIITHSQTTANKDEDRHNIKNLALYNADHEDLINDDFKHIMFNDSKNRLRVIYEQPDLGKSLDKLNFGNIAYHEKVAMAQQMINKFKKNDPGDIKLGNTVWDQDLQRLNYIDKVQKTFTFTTIPSSNEIKKLVSYGGHYENAHRQEVELQQILGLTYMLYQLFNSKISIPELIFSNKSKPDKLAIADGAFAKELQLAYARNLTLDQLRHAVDKLTSTQLQRAS